MRLDGDFFTVRDDEICLKLENRGFYCLVVISDIVLL